jgi:hypothetical protein
VQGQGLMAMMHIVCNVWLACLSVNCGPAATQWCDWLLTWEQHSTLAKHPNNPASKPSEQGEESQAAARR